MCQLVLKMFEICLCIAFCKLVCKVSRQACNASILDECISVAYMQLLLNSCTGCHFLPKDESLLSKPKVSRLEMAMEMAYPAGPIG